MQVVASALGAYAPAFMSSTDGMGLATANYPVTSVPTLGVAGYSVSTFGVSVPSSELRCKPIGIRRTLDVER